MLVKRIKIISWMDKQLYRSHNCGELRLNNKKERATLSGWIHRVRDLGGIIFLDLRDHYGITQVVINPEKDFYQAEEKWKLESVYCFEGEIVERDEDNVNPKIPTGEIELIADKAKLLNYTQSMPFNVALELDMPESMRLEYRYLDLRQSRIHENIVKRAEIIAFLRQMMWEQGFKEYQTPILTSSSPEGARDFLVPSRLHLGKFYALPQAPQQFKQLLMVAGFDKYFQIAPCFRDEDARADRSPGEFYQLDIEMSFASQEDIFQIVELVLTKCFEKFTTWKAKDILFPRIPYKEAMLKYGSDKPDLRNPLVICDITEKFRGSDFKAFSSVVERGGVVRAIKVENQAHQPRSFHDKLIEYSQSIGAKGLAYIIWSDGKVKSPITKFLSAETIEGIEEENCVEDGDVVYFIADKEREACEFSAKIRTEIANRLKLIDKNDFKFCWIVDYPMYEWDEELKKVDFSHNPFSLPQGGEDALENEDPLKILAYQYDLVCNGVELSSGALRNYNPELMYKAFAIAGYDKGSVDKEFSGLINAFKHGAPPHGGIAPGIDRIVMLILGEPNIREVIAFPFNQQAQDLMMKAPSRVSEKQLKELGIRIEEKD